MFRDFDRDKLRMQLNADLARRLFVMPKRPETFDALKARAAELEFFGLPPQPDKRHEVAYRLWEQLVTTRPVPDELLIDILPAALVDHRITVNQLTTTGHQQTSANWSGATVAADVERPFGQVYGRWEIPEIALPDDAAEGDEYACSIWIGLDGAKATSWSMPQAGTTVSVKLHNGAPEYDCYAWFQWWIRFEQRPPVKIPSIPVHKGDVMIFALNVLGPSLVGISVSNVTQDLEFNQKIDAPEISIPLPGYTISKPVEARTAEWIAERPMNWTVRTFIRSQLSTA